MQTPSPDALTRDLYLSRIGPRPDERVARTEKCAHLLGAFSGSPKPSQRVRLASAPLRALYCAPVDGARFAGRESRWPRADNRSRRSRCRSVRGSSTWSASFDFATGRGAIARPVGPEAPSAAPHGSRVRRDAPHESDRRPAGPIVRCGALGRERAYIAPRRGPCPRLRSRSPGYAGPV